MHLKKNTHRYLSGVTNKAFFTSLLVSFVWLLMVRASFIVQSGIWPTPVTALLSDAVGAFFLSVLLHWTSGLTRAGFIAVLGFACFVAGMHLSVHGTLFRVSLIGKGLDPTFLAGSLVNAESLMLPFYLFLAWLLHRSHCVLVPTVSATRKGMVPCVVILLSAYVLSFQSLSTPGNNVVASSLAQVPAALLMPIGEVIADAEGVASESANQSSFFHQQVAAPDVESPPNVLLIMVEGLSGGYFPGISAYHEMEPTVTLAHLENRLDELGFRIYRNALSMERQTDRGTFAILCGAYPDLRRQPTKMTDVVLGQASVDCIPERLKGAGYHTAYWQAAPLEYMAKHTFMPSIGFDDVTGAERFDNPEEIVGWGPPDPEYFDNIGDRIRQLGEDHSPWLVTLLNVGTHHPFDTGGVSPPDMPSHEEAPLARIEPQEARREAMSLMEQTLTEFLEQLELAGELENTLVIVTSDESGGFIRQDHETLPLNNNFGALAVRPPGGASLAKYADRDQIVAQVDIPLTILDAAGLGEYGGSMIGRSLLSTPDKPRDLLLADTYTGMKYFLRETGQLMACSEMTTRCDSWRFDPERLFGTLTPSEDPPFLTLRERLTVIERANYIRPKP